LASSSANDVLLALGSNLGNRRAQLAAAVARLGRWLGGLRASSLYETAPRYLTDQPSFLNMAVAGTTELSPLELLAAIQSIEADLGRERLQRYGPRSIDIDIVYYDGLTVAVPQLAVPHPLRAERRFVLAPLAEIAPDFVDPETGRTLQAMLDALPPEEGDCVRVGPLT
jgi:2-amino-4-hydroxy-6-hydroxymethyldihydropteridine diphosphokinase